MAKKKRTNYRRKSFVLSRDGAGRSREMIADMLERDLGIRVDPDEIRTNAPRAVKCQDICRWEVWGTMGDSSVCVRSWDRMGDIIAAKQVVRVADRHDTSDIEVCAYEKPIVKNEGITETTKPK